MRRKAATAAIRRDGEVRSPGSMSPRRSAALLAAVFGLLASTAAGADETDELRAALQGAPAQGLPAVSSAASPQALEDAVVRYSAAQHGQRLLPRQWPDEWAIRPAPYDALGALRAAKSQGRLTAWLAEQPPPDPAYAGLVQGLARYRTIADRGGWERLSEPVKPGATGPAVAALRQRLAVEDAAVAPGAVWDDVLESGVRRAQARLGLGQDGVAGRATLAALNVSAAERADQIVANLERWRWMPRNPPARRLELNIADASLALIEPGQPPLAMRVVVGQPDKRTPMFQDQIKAVVLNPPWVVPDAIAAKEIWPKIRKDPGYKDREGFVVRSDGRLEQKPGPRCALGTIKFDLSNPFGVYLHDTPARSLFAQPNRALSHGCMRVEQPNALAKRLLAGDPRWPPDNIDVAIVTGKTVRIDLKTPVPVTVAYWTAFVDPDGTVEFRRDVYGWDRALLERLAGP
jgi:murein L,D-transpeptidase YcbB/YkuD